MSAEEDDFRIEARLTGVGSGGSTRATPEYIDELRARQERQSRLIKGRPVKGFGEVMASSSADAADSSEPPPEAPPVEAESKEPVTPTPRPGLRRPSERDAYGVVRKTSVVIKV